MEQFSESADKTVDTVEKKNYPIYVFFPFGVSFGDQIICVLANKHELLLRTYSAAKFSVRSDKWEVSMIYTNISGSIFIC